MKIKFFISVILSLPALFVNAQSVSFPSFLRSVAQSNPYAQKIELIEPAADMEMRFARGAFDPKVQADFQQKKFDNKEYYAIGDARLSIPTFIGLKAEVGYQQNEGTYLNNQLNTPAAGLAYMGFSMPVLQGLRTDEARTAWQIAAIRQDLASRQAQWSLNELLYKASYAYIDLAAMYAELEVLNEGISNASRRLEFVKNSFIAGDKAAIDTTEARLQIQVWEAEKTELLRNLILIRQELNIFQWSGSDSPQNPQFSEASQLDQTLLNTEAVINTMSPDSTALNKHPRVSISLAKMAEAELKRKLAAESLKPQLDLKYNFLRDASEIETGNDITNNFNSRDYNWGLSFGLPLFLRKERAKIQLARISEKEAQLDYQYTLRETQTFIEAASQSLAQSRLNAERNMSVVNSYGQLLDAEQQKFDAGESSLFILNTRESKWIESKRKLIKSKAQVLKAATALIYTKGGADWQTLMQQ